jgi:hypothetical protein
VCELLLGRAAAALVPLVQLNKQTLAGDAALNPDAVEWSMLITCLLCLGRDGQAVRRLQRHGDLGQRPLAHLMRLLGSRAPTLGPANGPLGRTSLHDPAPMPDGDWTYLIEAALRACGRHELARALPEGKPALARQRWLSLPALHRHSLRGFDNPLWTESLRERLRRWAGHRASSVPTSGRTA